jgi:hypothetical protein
MKINKIICSSLILIASTSAVSADSSDENGVINSNYNNIKQQVCNQLDLTLNIESSPFIYTDPEASCDLGFQMPGLPDFNLGFQGLDSCKLLQSVTGELVNQVNQEMRDVVNDGLESVGLEDGELDIDFGDLVIDEIENGGG